MKDSGVKGGWVWLVLKEKNEKESKVQQDT